MEYEGQPYPNPLAHVYEELAIIKKQLKVITESQSVNHLSEILGPQALCERLNISRRTLDRLRRQKRIPYIQSGRLFRYDLAKVVEAMEKQKGK